MLARVKVQIKQQISQAIVDTPWQISRIPIAGSGIVIANSGIAIENIVTAMVICVIAIANSCTAIENSGIAIANCGIAIANSGTAMVNSGIAIANSGTANSNRKCLLDVDNYFSNGTIEYKTLNVVLGSVLCTRWFLIWEVYLTVLAGA